MLFRSSESVESENTPEERREFCCSPNTMDVSWYIVDDHQGYTNDCRVIKRYNVKMCSYCLAEWDSEFVSSRTGCGSRCPVL